LLLTSLRDVVVLYFISSDTISLTWYILSDEYTYKFLTYSFLISFIDSNIQVELDQAQPIKQLTGMILSPITSLFKNRITTSIADGLKEQMQTVMDDFNNEDPLQLREFTKKLVSAITGNVTNGSYLK